MALGKMRTMIGRLVVIAALALSIGVGSIAVSHPSDVSAAPDLSDCYVSYRLGQAWQTHGDIMWAYGYYSQARLAYSIANSYFSICGGGYEV